MLPMPINHRGGTNQVWKFGVNMIKPILLPYETYIHTHNKNDNWKHTILSYSFNRQFLHEFIWKIWNIYDYLFCQLK